jgi:alkylation response protein AidB-like acyl-CoA dehydrogenase
MDFEDTPAEAAFRIRVRAWMDENAPQRLRERLEAGWNSESIEGGIDPLVEMRAWQRKKFDAGLACPQWPKEYGGGGLTPIEAVILQQEEGLYAPLGNAFLVGTGMCGPTMMAWATEAQKQRHLPKLASGEEIWCQLFSEPSGGSDLAGLRTRAEPAGDGSGDWIVNGQKIWTSGAHRAAFGLLIARTDPDVPKHKGLTMFFLDMRSPGVEVRPIHQANGESEFNEVFFTDVRIPDAQRLGAVGQGWEVSLTTLMNERAMIGGILNIGFDDLLQLCRTVSIDGRPAIDDSAVRSRLASFAVRHFGLKYTVMRAITALSKGQIPGPENSIGKLVAAYAMQDLAMLATDILGPAGIIMGADQYRDGRFQKMLLRSSAMRVEGGSDEIMRNIIGERVLGLPGDIRVDKHVPFKDIPVRSA